MSTRATEKKALLSSTAIVAATTTTSQYTGDFAEALLLISVSEVSGTSPTLKPVVQVSDDADTPTWYAVAGGSTWVEADASTVTEFTGSTGDGEGTGEYLCAVTNIGRNVRVKFPTPGGSETPTWTLAVKILVKN